MINVLLWLPLAAGLIACLVPRRFSPWVATVVSTTRKRLIPSMPSW